MSTHCFFKPDPFDGLQTNNLLNYKAFFTGNDPSLNQQQIDEFSPHENFIVVGTSIFGAIEMACDLSKNHQVKPKVIIVDNSQQVHRVWEKLKLFFSDDTLPDNAEELLSMTDEFGPLLKFYLELSTDKLLVEFPDDYIKLENLFNKNQMGFIQQIIKEAIVLKQDWAHTPLFSQIKKTYPSMPIISYSSNIVDFVEANKKGAVIDSIQALNPVACIASDYPTYGKRPTKTNIESSAQVLFSAYLDEQPMDNNNCNQRYG